MGPLFSPSNALEMDETQVANGFHCSHFKTSISADLREHKRRGKKKMRKITQTNLQHT